MTKRKQVSKRILVFFVLLLIALSVKTLTWGFSKKNIGLAIRFPIPAVGGGMRARCYIENLCTLGSKSLHLPKFSKHGERMSR